MVKRLEETDRDILEFRPSIDFVEPDAEEGVIQPQDDRLQLEDIESERDSVKRLATAVNALATATQARIDDKAKNMIIKLDRNVDQDAIQAMRRKFPDANPLEITYDQYRKVKEDIRNAGRAVGLQGSVSPSEISAARDQAAAAGTNAGTNLGGFGTDDARFGLLRPELDARSQVIQPLDIEKLQISLICILVNFIWKNFIRVIFKPIAIPPPFGPSLADLLPKRLCNPGSNIEIPGLFLLGDNKIPDLLSGKAADKAKQDAGLNQ